jgi:hypothetical protein
MLGNFVAKVQFTASTRIACVDPPRRRMKESRAKRLSYMPDDRNQIPEIERLALYRQLVERVRREWAWFAERRRNRLLPHPLLGEAAEKITESILEDLFTNVLDWPLSSVNPQIDCADIVLTDRAIKRIIVEAKRPGSLAWSRPAFEHALQQAAGYAAGQKVKCIAISDATRLLACGPGRCGRQGTKGLYCARPGRQNGNPG